MLSSDTSFRFIPFRWADIVEMCLEAIRLLDRRWDNYFAPEN
jgi:hypothetical protein